MTGFSCSKLEVSEHELLFSTGVVERKPVSAQDQMGFNADAVLTDEQKVVISLLPSDQIWDSSRSPHRSFLFDAKQVPPE